MKRFFFLIAILLSSATSFAQLSAPAANSSLAGGPQVDSDEVVRRGNHVTYVDGYGDDGPDPVAEAMAPPQDDSYKWYITVLTTKGCKYCELLKRDFEQHPDLRAFVNVDDYKKSWAHFNFYSMDDATQAWRFKPPKSDLVIKGYPTLIVQPPFNGRYGKSSTIVMQKTGYDGDARKLAKQLSESIKRYVGKVSPQSPAQMRTAARRGEFPVSALRGQGESEDPAAMNRTWPANVWGQRTPPFPLPDNSPAPDLPPLNIPGPVDPDAAADKKPDDKKPATEPEAVLVLDGKNPKPAVEAQARRLLDRLRAERKPLAVRIVDLAFAKDLPVKPEETPAVVLRDGGRDEIVTGRLLPLLSPTPEPAAPVTIADLPWESIMLLLGGGGFTAAIPLVIWGIRFIRSRRQAAGKPTLLNDANLAGLLSLLQQIDFEKLLSQFKKA